MKIPVPKGYSFYDKHGNILAEEREGRLILYIVSAFKDVMYDLTYKVYGDTCVYCGSQGNTMDHRIPQNFGGPTIPNNMRPTCKNCNNLKSNMLEEEFLEYQKLSSNEKKVFLQKLKKLQEKRRYGEISTLPQEWLTPLEECYRVLTVRVFIGEPLGSKYKHLLNFFKTYKRHKNPLIISEEGVLLDGFNTLMIAKFQNRFDYDCIILDNVNVEFKR